MLPPDAPLLREPSILAEYPPARRYLIGVSGGRDSVALLHALRARGYGKLVVCHLDHRLRGRSAAADARFVGRLAAQFGCEFESATIDVRARAAERKESLETAARGARQEFFAEVARRRKCRLIFLAHHADDLAETFLMNLLRGAGPLGLGGMRAVARQKVGRQTLEIVRPLLGTWRSEIDAYIAAHGLRFREDRSNESLLPRRNRLRREIIPYLEAQLGRPVRESLWRAATIAAAEEEWIGGLLPAMAAGNLDVAFLRGQPAAVQRRLLLGWLRAEGVGGLDFSTVERVRALLAGASPAKTNLAGGWHVRRRAGKIFLEKPTREKASGA